MQVANSEKKEEWLCTMTKYRKSVPRNSKEEDYFPLGRVGGGGEEAKGKT